MQHSHLECKWVSGDGSNMTDDKPFDNAGARPPAPQGETRSEARIERRFRYLLEAAPDAILEIDRDGRIVLMNAATERLFGYSR